MSLNIKEEYHKLVIPRCRPPIRNIKKFNNNKERHLKRIIPKCRPPIRIIENSNKSNNNMPKDSSSIVHKQDIKMTSKDIVNNTYDNNIDNKNSDNGSLLVESLKVNHSVKSNSSLGDKHNVSSQISKPVTPVKIKKVNEEDKKNSKLSYYIFILLFVVIGYICFPLSQSYNNKSIAYDKQEKMIHELHKSITDAKLKFKSQKFSMWNAFSSQLEEIINGTTKVSIVILLGSEGNTIKCLAHMFGDISSKTLGGDNYLTLNAKNIGDDQGKIINKLKTEILIKRAVIIEDLLDINSEAIKTLHNLCDKENPLISKTMYIITIISNGYEELNEDKFVEDSLTAKFSKSIDLDILNPLITRIMDGPIISILPEPSMKGEKNIDECLLL
ncbi:uncharacterized protein LOC124427291 isoform X2 [Vespa crabro]|uniref:uncharacterized protein LOC124427291 isoform X2 n=1 Tax=Vespa crabro TaxID=7445 RepID=UPI001F019333|nr:uncharacterized protein LOC124427291 isoform X2 [Vespa crabro]